MTASVVEDNVTTIEHDLAWLERAVAEAHRRERALSFHVILRAVAILALALGAAAFLVLTGVRLLYGAATPGSSPTGNSPSTTAEADASATAPPTVLPEAARARIEAQQRALAERPAPQDGAAGTDSNATADGSSRAATPVPPIIFNYVIFGETAFRRDGFSDVTVGMRYPSSASAKPKPSHQWCYLSKHRATPGVEQTITLATMAGEGPPVYRAITPDLAEALGTTTDVLEEARKLCRFV